MYHIGIDIGSTTVKVVVLDENNQMLFRSYERHFSKVREKTCEILHRIEKDYSGQQVRLVITGSAGLGVAKASELDFVQEVYATAQAVNTLDPGTDAVIELGGEDAKIIFFGNSLEERMNGSCAGGTGAFIDQMATLLNVTVDELDALSLKHTKLYPIASRCGVFAKSDIQPILNQGGLKEDIAASIFQAVVDQTIAGLTQGRELTGKIVFLGGPLHFLQGLRQRFVETLQLDEEHAVFPEDGDCYAAIGSAMCAADYPEILFDTALDRLEKAVDTNQSLNTLPPLFTSREEYDAFTDRHNSNHLPEVDIHTYEGPAYLGIDAGSTTGCLADAITEHSATYVTNSVEIAHALFEKGCRVLMPAGEIKTVTGALVGEQTVETLRRFRFTIGFFGTNGATPDAGFTTPELGEALVKETALAHTLKPYVLCDSSKFSMVSPVTFADFDDATVVTDTLPSGLEEYANIIAASATE